MFQKLISLSYQKQFKSHLVVLVKVLRHNYICDHIRRWKILFPFTSVLIKVLGEIEPMGGMDEEVDQK